jgi:hypothetical protein
MLASSVADFLSTGFLNNPMNAKPNGIKDIKVSIRKFILAGNKFVNEIIKNERVAKNAEMAINLKPNPRPHDTIHVILPPNLSPSISGISKLLMNIICKNITGIEKIKKGRSKVPIKVK